MARPSGADEAAQFSPPTSMLSSAPPSSMSFSPLTPKNQDDVGLLCTPRLSVYRAFLHGIRDGNHESCLTDGGRRPGGEGARELASCVLSSALPLPRTALDDDDDGICEEDDEYRDDLHYNNWEEVAIDGDGEDLANASPVAELRSQQQKQQQQQQRQTQQYRQQHRQLLQTGPSEFEYGSGGESVKSDGVDNLSRTSQVPGDYLSDLERDVLGAAADAIPSFPKEIPTEIPTEKKDAWYGDGGINLLYTKHGPGGSPTAVESGGKDASLVLARRTSEILAEYENYLSDRGMDTLHASAASILPAPTKVPKQAADGRRGDVPLRRSFSKAKQADGSPSQEMDYSEHEIIFLPVRRESEGSLALRTLVGDGSALDKSFDDRSDDIENGGHSSSMRRQRYTQAKLRNKTLRRIVSGVVILCATYLVLGLTSNRRKGAGGSVQPVSGIAKALRQESKDLSHHTELPTKKSKGRTSSNEEAQTTPPSSSNGSDGKEGTSAEASEYIAGPEDLTEQYASVWYGRSQGWKGGTYTDAIAFCASRDSRIPCPYEAICPGGPGSAPTGGNRRDPEAWAPIMDARNSWVSVGSGGASCEAYNSFHENPPLWGVSARAEAEAADYVTSVMCCRAPFSGKISVSDHVQGSRPDADRNARSHNTDGTAIEAASSPTVTDMKNMVILDKLHPMWFGRREGYHGTTYQGASDFCESMGDMNLCPREAYCPAGPGLPKPLFSQREAFEGEQWAPVASHPVANSAERKGSSWVLVGNVGGATCTTYDQINHQKYPQWSVDGSRPELKQNILCCQNPDKLLKEQNYASRVDPIWLGKSHGWTGGSHDDAMEFCSSLGRRMLCPYTVYCPHGPGQPVMGGHAHDFNGEGEQWAPTYSKQNHWVMIGQKFDNSATTCMDSWGLEGREPYWGLTKERADLKNHIMCCAF